MPSLGIVPGAERTTDESLIRRSSGHWVYKRATNECEVPPLDIGVQAIQLSLYRSGVAGPPHTRLLRSPAFQPCACPLALSGPGQAVASESSALNSGLLWRQFTPCVTWRTVSLHPAQASQRPCEGRPVSSHVTCWLHDTTQKSMPSRGREHQWNTSTAMCNTFCTDSSVLLVPRHGREVCPLARRVMLPGRLAQPVSSPLQGGIRFFLHLCFKTVRATFAAHGSSVMHPLL